MLENLKIDGREAPGSKKTKEFALEEEFGVNVFRILNLKVFEINGFL